MKKFFYSIFIYYFLLCITLAVKEPHATFDAPCLCLVAFRSHDPPFLAGDHRFTPKPGMGSLFAGGEKSIRIDVQNGLGARNEW